MSCCPAGSWPALKSDYKPQGETVEANGMRFYVAGKAGDSGKAVHVFHDIFGVESGRTRAVCDQLAADLDCLVVLPDYFEEDALVDLKDIAEWSKKFPWPTLQTAIKDKVLPFMREKGAKDIGLWGFCWGSWAVFHASGAAELETQFKCGVNCHPSLRLEPGFYGGTEVAMAEKVTCPQLLLSAGNDPENVREGGEVMKVLAGKDFGGDCECKDFADMEHGWVNRGDVSQENVNARVKEALELGTAFLKKHL